MIVGISDRRPLLVIGVRAALDREEDIMVVEESVWSGPLQPRSLDVLLLDGRLADAEPDLKGLRTVATETNVLVVTSAAAADKCRFLGAGAKGCIEVEASPQELVNAVRTVGAAGGRASGEWTGGFELLSPRERDVLSHIARGYTHEQTAARLKISRHTVDTYVKRVRVKLRLGNKAELTRAALSYPVLG